MPYRIVEHKQRHNTRHIAIDTGQTGADGKPIVETFAWGMDVPLARVRKETRALLNERYAQTETDLPGVDTDL